MRSGWEEEFEQWEYESRECRSLRSATDEDVVRSEHESRQCHEDESRNGKGTASNPESPAGHLSFRGPEAGLPGLTDNRILVKGPVRGDGRSSPTTPGASGGSTHRATGRRASACSHT